MPAFVQPDCLLPILRTEPKARRAFAIAALARTSVAGVRAGDVSVHPRDARLSARGDLSADYSRADLVGARRVESERREAAVAASDDHAWGAGGGDRASYQIRQ